jgi:GH15 family glucan-1,4-alpha-glucosidase
MPEPAALAQPSPQRSKLAIRDYGLIGDCRSAALVSCDGSIDWLCLPHFSGPSVFAAILDPERGGSFAIRPSDPFRCRRRYVGASAVLETTFETASGSMRVTDLMPIVDDPSALHPMREILRVVEGVEGSVVVDVRFEPRPDYGRAPTRIRARGALGFACAWRDELFLLHADVPLALEPDGRAVLGRLTVDAGQSFHLSLVYAKGDVAVLAPLGEAAARRTSATIAWWEEWSGRCAYRGLFPEAVVRSAVTLKLMTFALSGAVVAAPTASLPEWVGADRNWDYRYCWLRDAAMTMRAFTGLGYQDEAGSFLVWLLHATRLTWPELQVLYDVYGRTNLREEELDHLRGYRDSRPVRIGNGAHAQVQLDVYGGVLLAALAYAESGGPIGRAEARLLEGFGETACRKWRDPDHGIWEVRGNKRHYTFSKVMCWAALDSLIKLHERRCVDVDLGRIGMERGAIAEAIDSRGYAQALQSYVGELDGNHVDAALLLIPSIGYKDASDPRMRGTFARIGEVLGHDGLFVRYEPATDGFAAPEGAFGIASFWAVENLARRGEAEPAERAFFHVLSFGNDLGLFAEEIDIATGAPLGNFPQAYTHVGLINAALALASAREGEAKS